MKTGSWVLWLHIGQGWGLAGGLVVKNPPANAGGMVPSLCWQDTLNKEMTTHSSILAWEISWTEGAWWATVHGVTKSQMDTTYCLNNNNKWGRGAFTSFWPKTHGLSYQHWYSKSLSVAWAAFTKFEVTDDHFQFAIQPLLLGEKRKYLGLKSLIMDCR